MSSVYILEPYIAVYRDVCLRRPSCLLHSDSIDVNWGVTIEGNVQSADLTNATRVLDQVRFLTPVTVYKNMQL